MGVWASPTVHHSPASLRVFSLQAALQVCHTFGSLHVQLTRRHTCSWCSSLPWALGKGRQLPSTPHPQAAPCPQPPQYLPGTVQGWRRCRAVMVFVCTAWPQKSAQNKNPASPFRKRTRGYIFTPFVFIIGISSLLQKQKVQKSHPTAPPPNALRCPTIRLNIKIGLLINIFGFVLPKTIHQSHQINPSNSMPVFP